MNKPKIKINGLTMIFKTHEEASNFFNELIKLSRLNPDFDYEITNNYFGVSKSTFLKRIINWLT